MVNAAEIHLDKMCFTLLLTGKRGIWVVGWGIKVKPVVVAAAAVGSGGNLTCLCPAAHSNSKGEYVQCVHTCISYMFDCIIRYENRPFTQYTTDCTYSYKISKGNCHFGIVYVPFIYLKIFFLK